MADVSPKKSSHAPLTGDPVTTDSETPLVDKTSPGVVNRTFSNRTQSNSNRLIDVDWVW